MSTEIKKEIALEIAHVLFIDIVGYSKLSINDQNAAVEELNRPSASPTNFNAPKPQVGYSRSRPVMAWPWSFIPVPKRRRIARWRSAARSRNIHACTY